MNNIYRNKTLAKECLLAFDKIILRYEMSKKKKEKRVRSNKHFTINIMYGLVAFYEIITNKNGPVMLLTPDTG